MCYVPLPLIHIFVVAFSFPHIRLFPTLTLYHHSLLLYAFYICILLFCVTGSFHSTCTALSTVHLSVYFPPEVRLRARSPLLVEGDDATFVCSATANPDILTYRQVSPIQFLVKSCTDETVADVLLILLLLLLLLLIPSPPFWPYLCSSPPPLFSHINARSW